jgi:hypothetical protein
VNLSLVFMAFGCVLALALQSSTSHTFHAHSQRRTGSFHIEASMDLVFPMFTPEVEKSWAAGWNPEYVFPADGKTTQGMVFRTEHSGPKTWIMTVYDPDQHRVAYVNVGPDMVIQISVNCRSEGNGTRAEVSYVHTALTEKGNESVDAYAQEHHEKQMEHWRSAISDALAHEQTGR